MMSLLNSIAAPIIGQVLLYVLAGVTVFSIALHWYNDTTEVIGEFYYEPVNTILLGGDYLEQKLKLMKKDSIQ